jgi:hypothetical protein
MRRGVAPLTAAYDSAALEFLSRKPFDNVFLHWLIATERPRGVRAALFGYFDDEGRIGGVAFFGRQVVIAADSNDAVHAFAQTAPAYRFERMIVAPRPIVERYWKDVRDWHLPPRAVRASQPVLAVDRERLKPPLRDSVVARRALPHEWQTVARNSARMIEHELEVRPKPSGEEFEANVRLMIDRGLWWVGESDGRLCFFCNAGPRSAQTLQLQGIWTPPHLRGKGLATAALFGVCDQLLREAPTLSLYVNDFNAPAIALYERLGFTRVGTFATYLFP